MLPQVISKLAAARPDFFSVTHGAGGSEQTVRTTRCCRSWSIAASRLHRISPALVRPARVCAAHLDRYREVGVRRIVACAAICRPRLCRHRHPVSSTTPTNSLRSSGSNTATTSRLKLLHILKLIRRHSSPDADFENFRRKVDAGADGALTQLFYNADAYFDFVDRCEKARNRNPNCARHTAHYELLENSYGSATVAAPICRAGSACASSSCSTTSRPCSILAWSGYAPLRSSAAQRCSRIALLYDQPSRTNTAPMGEPRPWQCLRERLSID